jgi:murein endopeptidase
MTRGRILPWLLPALVACTAPAPPLPRPPPPAAPPIDQRPAPPPAASTDVADDAADEEIADQVEEAEPEPGQPVSHPLAGWSDEQLERALIDDPAALGSISIGRPNGGSLMNGVQMPPGPLWELVDPAHAWGTQETVDQLSRAIEEVARLHPGAPRVSIGHISARRGGPLRPHRSHQSGRDVDVSYYYLDPAKHWYARATARNLDRVRTWALVRALVTGTDVDLILIDHSVQTLLREHALAAGEDPQWVAGLFSGPRPVIRHAPGHATHIHIRFFSPIAQETARRVMPILAKRGVTAPTIETIPHRARRGDTLAKLARRYQTTIRAIMEQNHLRTTKIQVGRTYRIPRPADPHRTERPVTVPARRLPPPGP